MGVLDDPEYWKKQFKGQTDDAYKNWCQAIKTAARAWSRSDRVADDYVKLRNITEKDYIKQRQFSRKIAEELAETWRWSEPSINALAGEIQTYFGRMLDDVDLLITKEEEFYIKAANAVSRMELVKKEADVRRLMSEIKSLSDRIMRVSSRCAGKVRDEQIKAAERVLYMQERSIKQLVKGDKRIEERAVRFKGLLDEYAGESEQLRQRLLSAWEYEYSAFRQVDDLKRLNIEVAEVVQPRVERFISETKKAMRQAKKDLAAQGKTPKNIVTPNVEFLKEFEKRAKARLELMEEFFKDTVKREGKIGSEIADGIGGIVRDLEKFKHDADALARAGDTAAKDAIIDRLLNRLAVNRIKHEEMAARFNREVKSSDFQQRAQKLNQRMRNFDSNFTRVDYGRLVENTEKNWTAALKQVTGLLDNWTKRKNVRGELLQEFFATIDKTRLGRRMYALLASKGGTSLSFVMEQAARSVSQELRYGIAQRPVFDITKPTKTWNLLKEFNAGLLAELNGQGVPEWSLIGDDLNKRLEEIKRYSDDEIKAIKDKVRGANGLKLAKEAPEEFAKCVRREAKRIEAVENSARRSAEWAYRDFFKQFDTKQGAGEKVLQMGADFLRLVRDVLADLVDRGIAEEKLPENIKPRLKDLVGKALKLGGWLVEGFVIGLVVDTIVETMEKFWVKVLTRMVAKHKTLQDLLAYKVFCDVTVEKIGYNIWSTDVNWRELFVVLIFRLIGLAIAESSAQNPTFAELIAATMMNNPDSLLAQIERNEKKTTAMAKNAIEFKTVVLFDVDLSMAKSRCIQHVAYNEGTYKLYIGFNDKKKTVYEYSYVPWKEVFEMMREPANAKSIGQYFNVNIRPKYKTFRRFEARLEQAVGKKGELEKKVTVDENFVYVDQPTKLSISPEVQKNKAAMEALFNNPGVAVTYLDSNNRVHYVYKFRRTY